MKINLSTKCLAPHSIDTALSIDTLSIDTLSIDPRRYIDTLMIDFSFSFECVASDLVHGVGIAGIPGWLYCPPA